MEMKLNGVNMNMQLDTGSYVTLIPKNIWEEMGEPKLYKSHLKVRKFVVSCLKTLGYFEGTFETIQKLFKIKTV